MVSSYKSNGITKSVADVSGELSTAYEKLHDYDHAFSYYKIFHAYSDTVIAENAEKKANKEQYEDELEQKAEKIRIDEKDAIIKNVKTECRNRTILMVSVIVALLVLGCILLYRLKKVKKKQSSLI